MNKEDNIQIQMRHFKMENVRLHGEVSRLSQYSVFLEDENKTIESEVLGGSSSRRYNQTDQSPVLFRESVSE